MDTENNPINEPVDFITFKDLVEQITGAKFDEIFGNFAKDGALNEQSNVE